MTRCCYVPRSFSKASEELIELANGVIAEYSAQGLTLTLRQLYYQMVSRAIIPNTVQSYKRLGSIINDARYAGLVDWEAIEDRTRNLATVPQWKSPQGILHTAARQYRLDHWATQPYRVECWVEKEALAGVIARACSPLYVPYLCCRGYVSASEMWAAAQRLGGDSVILYLGDHDPSGLDMTRDIRDRLRVFDVGAQVVRIALTMEQIEEHRPPPNPAKETDSRFADYQEQFGDSSWELDALEPQALIDLVTEKVEDYIDWGAWEEIERVEGEQREKLLGIAEGYNDRTR